VSARKLKCSAICIRLNIVLPTTPHLLQQSKIMFYYIVYFKSTKKNIYVLNSYYACVLRLTVTLKIALCGH